MKRPRFTIGTMMLVVAASGSIAAFLLRHKHGVEVLKLVAGAWIVSALMVSPVAISWYWSSRHDSRARHARPPEPEDAP